MGCTAARPLPLWVADITHAPIGSGLVYMAFVIDIYSRYIVSASRIWGPGPGPILRSIPISRTRSRCSVVIPAVREWLVSTTGFRPAPACCRQAGMTVGAGVRNLAGIAKGLSGWQQTHSHPRRHSSEGWNPGGGGRSGKGGRFCQMARWLSFLLVVIPAVREWLV